MSHLVPINPYIAYMASRLYREQKILFSTTWQVWSPATRKAFTTVALAHISNLLPQRSFWVDGLIKDLRDLGPELKDLKATGLIARNEKVEGGWQVEPQVMLWWCADELVRVVRADTPFEDWLRAQELDHLLTHKERENLSQMAGWVAEVLQQGASKLVESFASGMGKALQGKL
ncbi:MAG: hypothetical protein AB4426_18360 [Xenococcaceae cyanobacterium]